MIGFPKPKARKRSRVNEQKAKKFRDSVWARDGFKNGLGTYSGYCCFPGCGVLITQTENGTVDHIKPRSTHPELKYTPENGRLVCWFHNDYLKRHPLEREWSTGGI